MTLVLFSHNESVGFLSNLLWRSKCIGRWVCEATEEPPSLHLRRWPGLASQNVAREIWIHADMKRNWPIHLNSTYMTKHFEEMKGYYNLDCMLKKTRFSEIPNRHFG